MARPPSGARCRGPLDLVSGRDLVVGDPSLVLLRGLARAFDALGGDGTPAAVVLDLVAAVGRAREPADDTSAVEEDDVPRCLLRGPGGSWASDAGADVARESDRRRARPGQGVAGRRDDRGEGEDSVMGGATRGSGAGSRARVEYQGAVRSSCSPPQSAEIGCERSRGDRASASRRRRRPWSELIPRRSHSSRLLGTSEALTQTSRGRVIESAQVARPGPVMRQEERGDRTGAQRPAQELLSPWASASPEHDPRAGRGAGQLRDERPLVPMKGPPATTRSRSPLSTGQRGRPRQGGGPSDRPPSTAGEPIHRAAPKRRASQGRSRA